MNLVIVAIWLMLPAYVPNNFAALFGGGGRPLDMGRSFRDGRRILGDGKTFRGTILGTLSGIFVGLIQNAVAFADLPRFGDGTLPISILFALSFGAMLGDIIGSFIKRRFGFERGEAVILLDQLDFVIGCWALTLLVAPSWFHGNFTHQIIVIVLIITPILHRLTNMLGYRIKVKKEPW